MRNFIKFGELIPESTHDTTVSQKTAHFLFYNNLVQYQPISTIFLHSDT